jgi:hypothetical protein
MGNASFDKCTVPDYHETRSFDYHSPGECFAAFAANRTPAQLSLTSPFLEIAVDGDPGIACAARLQTLFE